jgi:hypothetical protein
LDQSVEDLELAYSAKGRTELVDLVGQLQPTVSIAKEQRFTELVVKPTKPNTTAVDQLVKAFKKLSINLLQQV